MPKTQTNTKRQSSMSSHTRLQLNVSKSNNDMCHKQIAGKAKQQIATDDMGQTVAALKEIVCILNILCFCIVKLLFYLLFVCFFKLSVQKNNRKNIYSLQKSYIRIKC